MNYAEDEYLQLSGLQHFSFCRRQWALIHIEQQWQDNLRTVEGNILHERAHNETIRERGRGKITIRGLHISSTTLGISGACDVVEFTSSESGARLSGEDGFWKPYPVEYKRGSSKANDADRLQLCAQAMCLEEMLCTDVPKGALFYGESRRREEVIFTPALRDQVRSYLAEMHQYYERGYTPKVKATKSCNACSLKDLCLPRLMKTRKVSEYIKNALREEVEECGDKKDAEDIVVEISE